MQKIHSTLKLAGLVFCLLAFSNAARADDVPPDNVEGNWTIYSTSLENGMTVVKHVQIAQYGNNLGGFFQGPDQAGPIQGTVRGHHIEFKTQTRTVITFRGEVTGNSMSGLFGIHGRHAGWQAVRTTGIGMAAPVTTVTATYQPPQPQPTPQPPPQPEQQPAPAAQTNSGPTPAPQTPDQLDALVAPIALYPDALVAQVLAASTNPDQVAYADDWLHQNSNLTGAALAQAVDQQSWDPSVKALTQFPSVMDTLAKNLSWTSSLGQAYENQQADVMAAVQAMRAKAQTAGTLQSTSQITVTTPAPGTIVIQPANPEVVYVPQYNPTVVYGAPFVVPYYTPPFVVATAGLSFGTGVALGAFIGGGGFVAGGGWGWGFHSWGLHWGGGGGGGGTTVIYNHNTYISRNTTYHNTTYNNYHPWGPGAHGAGPSGPHPYAPGPYRPDGYRPGYGPDRNQPNGGANGNRGLIGGNGGVQDKNAGRNGPGVAPAGGYNNLGQEARNENRMGDSRMNSSRMSGDGRTNRMESDRGRQSMAGRRPQQHMERQHEPMARRGGGGGGRRR
jgi:hypothetical protein